MINAVVNGDGTLVASTIPAGTSLTVSHLSTGVYQVSIAGMSSDWLYPVRLQQELGELVPTASAVEIVQTISGHDGFLVESEPLGRLIRRALE